MSFNTASIPDSDTIASATLTLTSPSTVSYPANSAVNIYSVSSISADNSNTRTVWRKPTELQSLTRVATRAANSAWVASTAYAWTSDATFPAAISKTGSTHLLIATGDQQAGTLRNTAEQMTLAVTGGSVHYLTVVHSFIGSATVAATASTTPAIARTIGRVAAISVSLTAVPTIARALSFARTIASVATGDPTLISITAFARTVAATIEASPLVTRTVAISRTISATITAIPDLVATYFPSVPVLARTVSLKVRSTISLLAPERIRLTVRSRLQLPEE
jgi:hypothetical protein